MSNIEIIKAYHAKLWDDKDLSAIDAFFDHEATIYSPVNTTQGVEAIKETMSTWLTAFPDLKVHWDDFICDETKVVARWHAQGTQKGAFQELPASNQKVRYTGITIYELADGKIINYWAIVDMLSILYQLQ